jgi:uncharacterized membrane protein YfcA
MIGAATAGLIGASILVTSFISGVFGMAGGLILLGILLVFLDVAPAMVLFGIIQLGANGWRATLWWRLVEWHIVRRYLVGAGAAFVLMRLIAFIPDKAVVYLMLGSIVFIVDVLPKSFTPDITRRWAPPIAGLIVMTLQLLAGAAGHILDLFFQKSLLDRRAVVATKAVCQVFGHVARIAYFGTFAAAWDTTLPMWQYAIAVALAIAGTSIAAKVLLGMTNEGFRRWSRWIVVGISVVYLARGLWLFIMGS